jgi:hypothetical protein
MTIPQIFSLLEPLDVLRLARTTKALRNVLMSRTDLTEPQYANLAFSEHCHVIVSLLCLCHGHKDTNSGSVLSLPRHTHCFMGFSC